MRCSSAHYCGLKRLINGTPSKLVRTGICEKRTSHVCGVWDIDSKERGRNGKQWANEIKAVVVKWNRTQCPLFINQERARGDYFSSWAADRLPTDGQTPTTSDGLKNTCWAFRSILLLLAVSRSQGSTGRNPLGASCPRLGVLLVFSTGCDVRYVSDFTVLSAWTRGLDVNWLTGISFSGF
jgi:hypothetical protein